MVRTVIEIVVDVLQFVGLGLRSHARLAAENLFLRKQLALYLEREAKPRRASNATRLTSSGSPGSSIGARPSRLCNRTRSFGGTATPFGCSGAGSLGIGDAREFRRTSSN